MAEKSGDLDRAVTAIRDIRDLEAKAREQGAERKVALCRGRMADILHARGELDEPLRIRREESLPV